MTSINTDLEKHFCNLSSCVSYEVFPRYVKHQSFEDASMGIQQFEQWFCSEADLFTDMLGCPGTRPSSCAAQPRLGPG